MVYIYQTMEKIMCPALVQALEKRDPLDKDEYSYIIEPQEDSNGHYWILAILDSDVVAKYEYNTMQEAEHDIRAAAKNYNIDFQGI